MSCIPVLMNKKLHVILSKERNSFSYLSNLTQAISYPGVKWSVYLLYLTITVRLPYQSPCESFDHRTEGRISLC